MNSSLLRRTQTLFDIRQKKAAVLACCWISGLLLGSTYSYGAGESYFLLMRMAATSRVSIVGLLFLLYFPFLIAAYFALTLRPQSMLILCFCKAFIFACCGFAATSVFGTAGWMIRMLLQFSDCCIIPFFIWFCLRNISEPSVSIKWDLLLCSFVALFVAVLDFCVISPFLANLIDS